mmetsp:Transcript_27276/g.76977  ORF Transcript_27276/g.76977 Transcript_27276/m.76977 type:complete len:611 (-) Transcript_27276:1661-3493(-)
MDPQHAGEEEAAAEILVDLSHTHGQGEAHGNVQGHGRSGEGQHTQLNKRRVTKLQRTDKENREPVKKAARPRQASVSAVDPLKRWSHLQGNSDGLRNRAIQSAQCLLRWKSSKELQLSDITARPTPPRRRDGLGSASGVSPEGAALPRNEPTPVPHCCNSPARSPEARACQKPPKELQAADIMWVGEPVGKNKPLEVPGTELLEEEPIQQGPAAPLPVENAWGSVPIGRSPGDSVASGSAPGQAERRGGPGSLVPCQTPNQGALATLGRNGPHGASSQATASEVLGTPAASTTGPHRILLGTSGAAAWELTGSTLCTSGRPGPPTHKEEDLPGWLRPGVGLPSPLACRSPCQSRLPLEAPRRGNVVEELLLRKAGSAEDAATALGCPEQGLLGPAYQPFSQLPPAPKAPSQRRSCVPALSPQLQGSYANPSQPSCLLSCALAKPDGVNLDQVLHPRASGEVSQLLPNALAGPIAYGITQCHPLPEDTGSWQPQSRGLMSAAQLPPDTSILRGCGLAEAGSCFSQDDPADGPGLGVFPLHQGSSQGGAWPHGSEFGDSHPAEPGRSLSRRPKGLLQGLDCHQPGSPLHLHSPASQGWDDSCLPKGFQRQWQ